MLLVMAKAPVAGSVKTRLCPPVSPGGGPDRRRGAAGHPRRRPCPTPRRDTGAGRHGGLRRGGQAADADAALRGWSVLASAATGLGDRLANAHADVAAAYPGRPVLQIGMDTPQLTPPGRLPRWRGALDLPDAVLGRRGRRVVVTRARAHPPGTPGVLRDVPCRHRTPGRDTWAALTGPWPAGRAAAGAARRRRVVRRRGGRR